MAEGARPKVSIIINVYSEEPRYLIEAIESVRAQTVAPFEMIVVEDGARRDYSTIYARYPELRIVRQDNQGLAAARNTGLSAASGDYIAFLDGDDRMTPRSLAINLQRLAGKDDAVLSYGAYRIIESDGRQRSEVRLRSPGHDPYLAMLEGNCIGMHATVLYRRAALVSVGGFDAAYRACEDYELYLRLARRGRFLHGPEVLADYRYHGANMSGDRVMMLNTSLRVLAAQNPHVRGNPDRERASARGRREWRAYYVRVQLHALLEALTNMRHIGRALGGSLRIFSMAPVVTIREATMELLRRLRPLLPSRSINLGALRQLQPISRNFGYERGNPVDRRYIERFLSDHAADIRGRVLEIGDNAYTLQFGGSRVEKSEVLHVNPDAPNVTYCTDITTGEGIPDSTFDCIVLTQTLHLVYEFQQAVETLLRILKPGGVLLLTVPGVSSVDRGEWGETWFWSFTPASLRRLMSDRFGADAVALTTYGNVLTATAFLYGLAERDLQAEDYDYQDPQFPVIVAARVMKG
jgi:glycosyltransferase involved in cell wall biosynthesis/SAM-dependent methyltransferase